jgi:hypothetical protein
MAFTKTTFFDRDPAHRELVASHFDRRPFQFRHQLHTLDIFRMPALLDLAEKAMMKRNRSHYESGDARIGEYFGAPPPDLTIRQALEQIAEGKNWVILKRIHEEPSYFRFLNDCIDELAGFTGLDLRKRYHDPILTVFITSPNRTTPYHMDSEANFLAQVQGSKSVFVYDANDRSILSCEDLERYWTGNFRAARYRADLLDKGVRYQIGPGFGVFNPATFPHWVQNDDSVSVSVSINFKRVDDPQVGAYCANHYARKIGLKPTEPGVSPSLDRMKNAAFGRPYWTARRLRKRLRAALGL